MPNPPLIAVDTNFLIDLAAENPTCLNCLAAIRSTFPTAPILVLPTVIIELSDLALNGKANVKALASSAIQKIKVWKFQAVNYVPVGHGIVEATAKKIRAADLLPPEEVHDSLVIAEAALANVTVLISSDTHLKDIDHVELHRILDGCDLANTEIVPPWAFTKVFGKQ